MPQSKPTRAWLDANLRMNDILTVGTHNSYKQAISEPILELLRGGSADGRWQALDYSHPPLTDQLDDGARALELDVFYDPEGGRYAHPAGMTRTNQPIPPEYVAAMSKPGFKVIHIQDLDFRSSVPTLIEGLTVIRDWSNDHPDHVPILITMNTSDGPRRMRSGVDGLPFTTEAYDALDAEVASVFPPHKLITPDDIRGDYPTLRRPCASAAGRSWATRAAGSCSPSTRPARIATPTAAAARTSRAASTSFTPTRKPTTALTSRSTKQPTRRASPPQ
jgi:hypothetical protein